MPRTKSLRDEEVLAAAGRVFTDVGPAHFTLADVSRACGLAPATLLQRYGSKRGLLVAFAEFAANVAHTPFELARAKGLGALDTLLEAILSASRRMGDRARAAHGIAFLLEDLRDDALHDAARRHAERTAQQIRLLLDEAMDSGELRATDSERLARSVQAIWNGAVLQWALRGDESLESWLRADVEAVLAPYRN